MKITRKGHAIVEHDNLLSAAVENWGQIDYGCNFERLFRKFISPGDYVIDVGAFIGDHTVPFAEIVGPEGRVLSFEPNPLSYECLQWNTRNYPWIVAHPFGCGQTETKMFTNPHENLGGTFLTTAANPDRELSTDPANHTLECEVRPLEWVLNTLPASKKINFVKIDVEGMEIPVLESAPTLVEHRPFMFIEVALCNQVRYGRTSEELYQYLDSKFPDYIFSPEWGARGDEIYDVQCIPKEKLQTVLSRAFQ
jgi:FkbM family methyltransferase